MNVFIHHFSLSRAALLLLSALNSQLSTLFAQGPLTPPGAPAPTMKTLQQIEPRVEINATNTPGDADSQFKITHAGSYYLSDSIGGDNSTAASTPTTGMGFSLGNSSTIQNCTASDNEGDGINVVANCVVRDNLCGGNGASGNGAGVHATGTNNRIEANNVTTNDRGFDVDVAGNIIIRNSAKGNGANYSQIVAGNTSGEVVDTTGVGGTLDETHGPWANFSY